LGRRRPKRRDKTRSKTDDQAQLETPPAAQKRSRVVFQEYSEAFVVAVILAIVIRAFIVQAFKIPSGSMESTLLVGDHILVNKFIYGVRVPFTHIRWPRFKSPSRGDVIVFVFPMDRSKDFIKRVVAVGGDTVEVVDKKVFVNGKERTEPYVQHVYPDIQPAAISRRDNMPPLTVPKGYLFVMGDNRDASHDSRFWRFVPVEDVKGEAFLIYYSALRFPFVRWGRLFQLIH
jgi:signal peptidase I